MTIRPIIESDNKELAKIVRETFIEFKVPTAGTVYEDPTTDDLHTLFQTPGSFCFVAEEQGELAGCCGIFPTANLPGGYAELVKFYLSPKFRGRGLGKLLIEKCIGKAREFGISNIYIETVPKFTNAIAMYEKMDFEYLEAPLGNSGHGGCPIWMAKRI